MWCNVHFLKFSANLLVKKTQQERIKSVAADLKMHLLGFACCIFFKID
jgi:hypothetical protein